MAMWSQGPRWAALLALCGVACDGPAPALVATPLQPLIYTELPDVTPEAAALRERRLMRELLDGARVGERWGHLERRAMAPPRDAQALGEALYQALMTQDEALWEHTFVSPEAYARMVRVSPAAALKFTDEVIAQALPTWQLFAIARPSEVPQGGLGEVFSFEGLELGQGRLASGRLSRDDEPVDQHWGNVLRLGLRDTDVVFEVRVPKILRVVDRARHPSGEPILALAAPAQASDALKTFIEAGLHLKQELLRSQEYPYPLTVGNFWRYRRFSPGEGGAPEAQGRPEAAAPIDEVALSLEESDARAFAADEVLLEVISLERYGSVRLVGLRESYNDAQLTRLDISWLVTPRRIYACPRDCVRHIEEVGWLLSHMQRETPLLAFPLRAGQRWGRGERETQLGAAPEEVEVPAGAFIGCWAISGRPTASADPFMQVSAQRRLFAAGKGVVRRELRGVLRAETAPSSLVEELVEYRIMP